MFHAAGVVRDLLTQVRRGGMRGILLPFPRMKSIKHSSKGRARAGYFSRNKGQVRERSPEASKPSKWGPKPDLPAGIRTVGRIYVNPVEYAHPYESMGEYAASLALRHDANRTCHAYYRQVRLIHEHFECDPATLTEEQLRDYFLFVKLQKEWQPKTIRQAVAAARTFFVDLLGRKDWTLFSQIRTKDHDILPAVLTRQQVHDVLDHVRLRRYRTPLKLIYCCGLRLSECLGLTIHDIRGRENKLLIRESKGHQGRVVPLPTPMYEELRRYWAFHRHSVLIFPNVGRGVNNPQALAKRMRQAESPMPPSSLQRLLIIARKHLNIPDASVHSLRHYADLRIMPTGTETTWLLAGLSILRAA